MSTFELEELKAAGRSVKRAAEDYKTCADALVADPSSGYQRSTAKSYSSAYDTQVKAWITASTAYAHSHEGQDLTEYNKVNSEVNQAARTVYDARRAVESLQ